jgi:hypothetical protein
LAYYEGAMDYQGKLLEHQLNIAVIKGNVSLKQLKEMRKQLDELMMDKSMTESDNGQLIDRGSFAKYVENKKGEK